jgi:hypothetical protein
MWESAVNRCFSRRVYGVAAIDRVPSVRCGLRRADECLVEPPGVYSSLWDPTGGYLFSTAKYLPESMYSMRLWS